MKKPKYCDDCGKALVAVKSENYDIYTGKQRVSLECTSKEKYHFSMEWPRIKGWDT